MSYKSILVNLDIDGPIVPVVKAAAHLAGRFQARLIGFCAADAPMPMAGPEGSALAAETWMQMREDIQSRLKELRGKFAACGHDVPALPADLSWPRAAELLRAAFPPRG